MPVIEPAKEHRQMDASDLYRALETFFRDNQSHHRIENRWLADKTIKLKMMAFDLGTNGVGIVQSKYGDELAALRLLEIEEERRKIAKADDALAKEAERLKREAAKAAA